MFGGQDEEIELSFDTSAIFTRGDPNHVVLTSYDDTYYRPDDARLRVALFAAK